MGNRRSKFEGKFPPGYIFGDWAVVDGSIHGSPARIDVRCICGTVRSVDIWTLQNGRSTNCGCKNHGETAKRYNGVRGLSGTAIYRNSLRAESKSLLNISNKEMAELYQQQSGTCTLTGQTINSDTARLERIDVNKPYETGNVQWVHSSVASMASKYGTSGVIANSVSIVSTTKPQNIFEQLGMKPTGEK